MQDAYLPQRLVDKLMYMYNYIEMARVTGVPMSFLLTRGQSIKVFSQILRKARQKDLLVPFLKVCRLPFSRPAAQPVQPCQAGQKNLLTCITGTSQAPQSHAQQMLLSVMRFLAVLMQRVIFASFDKHLELAPCIRRSHKSKASDLRQACPPCTAA